MYWPKCYGALVVSPIYKEQAVAFNEEDDDILTIAFVVGVSGWGSTAQCRPSSGCVLQAQVSTWALGFSNSEALMVRRVRDQGVFCILYLGPLSWYLEDAGIW